MDIIDLFCGAGGMSLGFERAGFHSVLAIDKWNDAIVTYNANREKQIGTTVDIHDFSNEQLETIKKDNDIRGIIGGPPCQGFSLVGTRLTNDPRNSLYMEYVRFVSVIRPDFFVLENVPGLLSMENGKYRDDIIKRFSELGYNVNFETLKASDYGVPQKRERAIFVGIRNDLNTIFDFKAIKKKKTVNVKEAISDLYGVVNEVDESFELDTKPQSDYQKLMRKNSDDKIYNHLTKFPCEKVQKRMEFVPQGGNWRDVPPEMWDTQRTNRHSSAYRRLNEKDVSITIDTGHMNYFHPLYNRVPTVRESARIQSFPDDFVFVGNKTNQYLQVGNAVPPLMAQALASAILEVLKEKK